MKLKDRVNSYEEASDFKLLNRVPLVISINGRSFAKATSLLDKPYCEKFAESMYSTMLRLVAEIEGAVFGYSFNDEIIIIARNDQNLETTPWYDNKIQKISSVTSSIATLHFNNCINSMDLIMDNPVFISHVYAVPNLTEAINVIISKQQQSFQTSIYFSCLYEFLKKYNKDEIREMLSGTTIDEKINLLQQEVNVNFNDYPVDFKRGAACYRVPKIIDGSIKHKWTLNNNLPIFTKEHSFLGNIFKGGSDIIRKDSL